MNAVEVMALIRASNKPHYCYILHKPDGTPFYVGVGRRRRLLCHAHDAKNTQRSNIRLKTIRKIWRNGGSIDYRVHAFYDNHSKALEDEVSLIASIGRRDLGTGPLTNLTAGGDGLLRLASEVRKRISESMKKEWDNRDRTVPHLNNAEVQAKASASKFGMKSPKINRENFKWDEVRRKRWRGIIKLDPPSRRAGAGDKISKANLGKLFPDHHMKSPAARLALTGARNPQAKPLEIDGVRYECATDARASLGVSKSTIEYWLRHSLHGARHLPRLVPAPQLGAPIEIDGVIYGDCKAAVDAIGETRTTIERWIKLGLHGAKRLPKQ